MSGSILQTARTLLWTLVAVAAIGAGWLYFGRSESHVRIVQAISNGFGQGSYQLISSDGKPFRYKDFLGKPAMVFFGFTHCPDVCPTTLSDMVHWYSELGEDADELNAFFVSVDPERDTPELIGEYVGWTERVVGITGERAEIDKAIKAWGVYTQRSDLGGGAYNVDHTASVFLIDADGEFFGTIAYEEQSATAIGKLRRLLAQN